MKSWLEILNSKFAFVAVIAVNLMFTVWWVEKFTPYTADRKVIERNLTQLMQITKDMKNIVMQLAINDSTQDVKIEELKGRIDRINKHKEWTK